MKSLSLFVAALLSLPPMASGAEGSSASAEASLHATVAALDSAVFDAFNRCSDPAQLEKHASYFADDVEFYHDTGGVTWDRESMLANTRRYACGRFSRELLPGTLRVHPVRDYGAIAQGSHRFCQLANGACDGVADFTMVWRNRDGVWQLTRVLSYGHRAAGDVD